MSKKDYSMSEAFVFSQRMTFLSKALWRAAEKDWERWIKPFDLNINEHHILYIVYHMKVISISEIAEYGVMHVSTAFNFSKKLIERGFLVFSKRKKDRRNTYVKMTPEGKEIFLRTVEQFDISENTVIRGGRSVHDLYGKFPEAMEITAILSQIYGEKYIKVFEKILNNIENDFSDVTQQ